MSGDPPDQGSSAIPAAEPSAVYDRTFRLSVACAMAAVLVSALAVAFSLYVQGWNVSALVRMDDQEPMASFALRYDPGFAFVPEGHYDGVYFYALAVDPLARGEAHQLIDHAAYRYGHVGYSWVTWLFTLGNPYLVPYGLLFVALVGTGLGTYAAARIAALLGWSPWGGLVVGLQPGVVYAATVLTSEPVAFAVVGLALLLWLEDRLWPSAVLLAFAGIVKEPLVFVPVSLFVFELLRRPDDLRKRAAILGATLIPTIVWQVYIYLVFDITSFADTASPLRFPTGWIAAMREAAQMGLEAYERTQSGTIAVPILAIAFSLLLVGLIRAVRLRSVLDPIFILQALVVFGLSPTALTYPKDFFRTTVFALALVIPVVFGGAKARRSTPAS